EGRLIDFPPMYRLSRFVEEEQLAALSFSKITNQITIEDARINIPEMRIESNVSNIELSGWHTLDQHLEYHLKVPLRRKYKRDKDERYGVIQDPEKNVSNLFLKVTGTTDDYKFSYDRKAVLNKVKQDIKKEGRDLINTFKQKGQKQGQKTSLSDEEFFDFTDSTKTVSDTTKINQWPY
ncbi:MAG: AsmA-like C-terminal region-containing protein, partial [Bacteroidota bacterium]